jgi:hypothetical protein
MARRDDALFLSSPAFVGFFMPALPLFPLPSNMVYSPKQFLGLFPAVKRHYPNLEHTNG